MKRFPRVCRKIWKANKKSEIETESRKSKLFLRHRTSWFRLPECEKDVVRYTEGPLATSFFHFSPKALRLFLESSFSWPQAEAEPLTQNLASVLGYDALSQKNKEQKLVRISFSHFHREDPQINFFGWCEQHFGPKHLRVVVLWSWKYLHDNTQDLNFTLSPLKKT